MNREEKEEHDKHAEQAREIRELIGNMLGGDKYNLGSVMSALMSMLVMTVIKTWLMELSTLMKVQEMRVDYERTN